MLALKVQCTSTIYGEVRPRSVKQALTVPAMKTPPRARSIKTAWQNLNSHGCTVPMLLYQAGHRENLTDHYINEASLKDSGRKELLP